MTKIELAKLVNVSRITLNNWEKDKPELVRLINQGLLMDDMIEENRKNLEKLEELQAKSSNGKFNLK